MTHTPTKREEDEMSIQEGLGIIAILLAVCVSIALLGLGGDDTGRGY